MPSGLAMELVVVRLVEKVAPEAGSVSVGQVEVAVRWHVVAARLSHLSPFLVVLESVHA